MRSIKPGRKGYALLEVILALSILGVSLVVLIQAYVLIDRSRMDSLHYIQALMLRDYKLHDIWQDENLSSSAEGGFASPFEQFQWQVKKGLKSSAGFQKVHLTISWPEYQKTGQVMVSTYMRRKDASPQEE